MVESRVQNLEETVGDLRAVVAAQTVEIRHLTAQFGALQKQLEPLTESVNKGKGALAVAMLLAGMAGYFVDAFFSRLFK
jgi:uncharacterized coiled-coil protein SlyX